MRILARLNAAKHSRTNIKIKSAPKIIRVKNCQNMYFFNMKPRKISMPMVTQNLNFIFRISTPPIVPRRHYLTSLPKINTHIKQKYIINRAWQIGANHKNNKYLLLLIFLLLLAAYVYSRANRYTQYDKTLKTKFQHSLLHLINGNMEKFLSEIIHLSKENDELKSSLLLLENGQVNKAIKILDNLFLYKLKIPDAYNLLKGIIYNSIGDYEKAIKHLNKVIYAKSEYIRSCAYYHLSISYKSRNKDYDISEFVALSNFNKRQIDNTQTLYQKLSKILKIYPNKINYKTTFLDLIFQNSSYSGLNDSNLPNLSYNGNTIIRIWLPTSSTETGHVSLQTEKHYISFWPIDNKITANTITNIIIESQIGRFAKHNSLWDDMKDENRLPDVRLALNLNINAINEAYEHFVQSKYQWSLLGSIFTKSQNCSGLVCYLLLKGGLHIDQNILSKFAVKQSFMTSNVALAASTADLWGPIAAYPVKLIPYVGIPLSFLLENAPKLTAGAIGFGGLIAYYKTITPDNINLIATSAFLQQRIKSNITNALELQDIVIKESLQSGFA